MKVERLWVFERTSGLSKAMLFLLAVPQTRPSPTLQSEMVSFGLHSFVLVEDRNWRGLGVNSLIIMGRNTSYLMAGGNERLSTPLTENIA